MPQLTHVYLCTGDTVSLFQFMENVAVKIPSKWKRVGVAFGLNQSQIDAIDIITINIVQQRHIIGIVSLMLSSVFLMCSSTGKRHLLTNSQRTGPPLSVCCVLIM